MDRSGVFTARRSLHWPLLPLGHPPLRYNAVYSRLCAVRGNFRRYIGENWDPEDPWIALRERQERKWGGKWGALV